MRIAYIAAGAGSMYCGSCLRDNALAAALIAQGRDIVLAPAYTPMKTDEECAAIDHVVCGAMNVYLQHASPIFRHTPRFIDRLLDNRSLLRFVSRFSNDGTSGHRNFNIGIPIIKYRINRRNVIAEHCDRPFNTTFGTPKQTDLFILANGHA